MRVHVAVQRPVLRRLEPARRLDLDAEEVDLLLLGVALQPHPAVLATRAPAAWSRRVVAVLLPVLVRVVRRLGGGVGVVRAAVVRIRLRLDWAGQHVVHPLHVLDRVQFGNVLARRFKVANVVGQDMEGGVQLVVGVAECKRVGLAAFEPVVLQSAVVAEEKADPQRHLELVTDFCAAKELDVRLAVDAGKGLVVFERVIHPATRGLVERREHLGGAQPRVLDALGDAHAHARNLNLMILKVFLGVGGGIGVVAVCQWLRIERFARQGRPPQHGFHRAERGLGGGRVGGCAATVANPGRERRLPSSRSVARPRRRACGNSTSHQTRACDCEHKARKSGGV